MTSPRHVATHLRPPRHTPPPLGALVVLAAAVAAAAALGACAATSSAWPAVVLPALAAALGGVAVGERAAVAAAAVLLGTAGASLAFQPEPVAAAGLLAAVAASALVLTAWRVHRVGAQAALVAERERTAALSIVDDLTGCFNTHGLELLGEHVLALARRQSGAMHCAVVEVEGVAPVLDALGAPAVEEVLVAVSEALRSVTRGSDVVCRSGEVTFLVVGPGTGMGALDLERRLRGALLQAPPLSLREWPCTVVVGVGQMQPWDSGGVPEVVASADEDLGLRRALRAPALDPQSSASAVDPGV